MELDIYDKFIDNSVVKSVNKTFNVEINNNKVYDQKGSFTCWIYSAFNMIRNELTNQFKEDKLDFSVNYVSFFDRYEKMNLLYNKLITEDYKDSKIKYLLFDYINPCGDFSSFKYLIKKYGIVLEHQMPMLENNFIPNNINELIKEKIINDIEIISKNKNNIQELKEKMMLENYQILSSIFGQPPIKFDSKFLGIKEELTPLEFENKYLCNILDNYVEIVSLSNLVYNKKYQLDFNVPNLNKTQYLNLTIDNIKECIVKSLKDGSQVWFGCSYRYMSTSYKNKVGVLYSNLYNFKKLGVSKLNKTIAEKYNFLSYDHAMVFTGVNIVDNRPVAWKVLNSFGIQNNDKGYFTMDNAFFDENVFLFAINKKYLSQYI